MPEKKYTISHYLIDRLREFGVEDIFGVPGDFVLGFFHAMESSDINTICTCNELNAAYAADGYARIKGMGAIASTYVVGELSAINGIAGAFAEKVPVVKVTGSPATKHYQSHTMLHHTIGNYTATYEMYKYITVASTLLNDASKALSEIDRVLKECFFHKLPVYIGLPADIALTECEKPKEKLQLIQRKPSNPKALEEAISEASELLSQAKKPIIVVDGELTRFGNENHALKFIEATGIPFASMLLGKSIIEEHHPQFIGMYGGSRSREYVKNRVEGADCIISLGLMPTDFNTGGFTAQFDPGKSIVAQMDSISIKYHQYHCINFVEFLEGVGKAVKKRDTKSLDFKPATEGCPHRATMGYEAKAGEKLTMARFYSRISHFLNKDSIMMVETGSALFSGAEVLQPEGCNFMAQTFFGSIGYTVGSTLGTQLAAKDKRVCTFVGDGSFQVTCQEISTMVRYQANPIIFLINNEGYLIERVIIDGPFNDIQPWKYSMLPEVFCGGIGLKVQTEDDLEDALEKANAHKDKLVFIEVLLDRWDGPESLVKAGEAMAKTNFLK